MSAPTAERRVVAERRVRDDGIEPRHTSGRRGHRKGQERRVLRGEYYLVGGVSCWMEKHPTEDTMTTRTEDVLLSIGCEQ